MELETESRRRQAAALFPIEREGVGSLCCAIVSRNSRNRACHGHYLEVTLPGFAVGAIIGFLTQKMGIRDSATRREQ